MTPLPLLHINSTVDRITAWLAWVQLAQVMM